jgi:sugar phosphate isomerase/epimerase
MYDLILENTDEDLVKLAFDAYWAFRGGVDPVEYIRKYGRRIRELHVKDFPFYAMENASLWTLTDKRIPVDPITYMDIIKKEHFIELGDGMLKIQDIIDAANEFSIPYLFIEQDWTSYPSQFESVEKSLSNMRKMRGINVSSLD